MPVRRRHQPPVSIGWAPSLLISSSCFWPVVLPSFLAVVELTLTAFGSGFFSIAFASCTSLTSVLALSFGVVLAAGFVVVLAGVVLAVVAVASGGERRGSGGAEALDLQHLLAGRLALGDPVADEQAGDDRQQQHRQQPEQARVAAQPGVRTRYGLDHRGVAGRQRGDLALAARVGGLGVGLEHVEEREPHGRHRLAARQAVALVGRERRAAVRATRGVLWLLGGHGREAHGCVALLPAVRSAGRTGRTIRPAHPNAPRT